MYYFEYSANVNVFVAISGYANELCGRLINSGYSVRGAFKGGLSHFSNPDYLGEIISIIVKKPGDPSIDEKPISPEEMGNLVRKILDEMDAKYFGISVNVGGAGLYYLSNILLPKEIKSKVENEEPKSEAPVQDNS